MRVCTVVFVHSYPSPPSGLTKTPGTTSNRACSKLYAVVSCLYLYAYVLPLYLWLWLSFLPFAFAMYYSQCTQRSCYVYLLGGMFTVLCIICIVLCQLSRSEAKPAKPPDRIIYLAKTSFKCTRMSEIIISYADDDNLDNTEAIIYYVFYGILGESSVIWIIMPPLSIDYCCV